MTKRLSPLFSWRGALIRSELSPNVRYVALVLSMHMNELGGSCYPSQALLAEESGLSERQVRRHLATLRQNGWLELTYRRTKRGYKRAFYEATVPIEGWLPKDPPDMDDLRDPDMDDLWMEDMGDRSHRS